MDYSIVVVLFIVLISAGAGFLGGAFYSKKRTEKELKENPPISEKQIRAMYASMGRTPSETQVQSTLRAMGLKK